MTNKLKLNSNGCRFARTFNADGEQRNLLWKSGFIGTAKPNLLKQETQALSCCLRLMFRLYTDPAREGARQDIHCRLLPLCTEVKTGFNVLNRSSFKLSYCRLCPTS